MIEGAQLRSARIRGCVVLVVALTAISCGAVLYLGRRFDFYYDEWSWLLNSPKWTLSDYFKPHNEHWSTLPRLIYKLILAIGGAHSYLPFLATLLALHGLVVVLLFYVIRRRSGDVLALAGAMMLVLLGRGWEDLLWAFQIGFVGSVAFGLLALLLVDRPAAGAVSAVFASVALLASIMSSGIGLFFWLLVGVDLALSPSRRRLLGVLLLPGVAYVIWQIGPGRTGLSSHRFPFSMEAVVQLVGYVPSGVGSAMAGLFSFGDAERLLAFGAVTALLAVQFWRCGVRGSWIAPAVAVVAEYAVIGLVRAQYGNLQATAPRYIYVGAIFLVLLLTAIARDLPRTGVVMGLLAVMVISVVGHDVVVLRAAAHARNAIFSVQDSELESVYAVQNSPGLDRSAVIDPVLMPGVTVKAYLDNRALLGSPLPQRPFGNLPPGPASAVNAALRNVLPFRISGISADRRLDGEFCTPTVGGVAESTVAAKQGHALVVRSDYPGTVSIAEWVEGPIGGPQPTSSVMVQPGQALLLEPAASGFDLTWRVRIQLPGYDQGSICTVIDKSGDY
jgi:hypothetical protein